MAVRRKAVFLDKDGTLLENVPFNVDPRKMRFLPRTGAGLRVLQALGFALFVVSNQSGVAQARFGLEKLRNVEDRLQEMFALEGVMLSGFYCCPHDPQGSHPDFSILCDCRKPEPGLLHRIERERRVELARSWMIGDILNDVEAGNRAGCRSVLLHSGGETEWIFTPERRPHYIAYDLEEAARWIVRHEINPSNEKEGRA